jgi:ubiquinone biosynthesis protein UbiJ
MIEQLLPYIGAGAVALISAAATVLVGWLVYRSTRKGDEATEKLTERRDTIADRDSLIETLREDMKGLKSDMADLRVEVRQVRNHNNALTTFIYKMLAILRQHNLTDEINPKDVPEDIHI